MASAECGRGGQTQATILQTSPRELDLAAYFYTVNHDDALVFWSSAIINCKWNVSWYYTINW